MQFAQLKAKPLSSLTLSSDKANALNQQFLSVFTQENSDIPTLPSNQYPYTENIDFTSNGIKCILENLDSSKPVGPDSIPTRILKLCATEISAILQVIFSQSFKEYSLVTGSRTMLYLFIRRVTQLYQLIADPFHLHQCAARL